MPILRGRFGRGLGVVAARRLDDQSVADRLGAHLDSHDSAIDQGADLLNIRPEFPSGNAGDLRSNAAEVFCLAAMGDLVSEAGFLAGEMTNAWHCKNPQNISLSVQKFRATKFSRCADCNQAIRVLLNYKIFVGCGFRAGRPFLLEYNKFWCCEARWLAC